MTVAYNEHLSATQGAWWQQGPMLPALTPSENDSVRDLRIAGRRYAGTWLPEDEVMGALERTDV